MRSMETCALFFRAVWLPALLILSTGAAAWPQTPVRPPRPVEADLLVRFLTFHDRLGKEADRRASLAPAQGQALLANAAAVYKVQPAEMTMVSAFVAYVRAEHNKLDRERAAYLSRMAAARQTVDQARLWQFQFRKEQLLLGSFAVLQSRLAKTSGSRFAQFLDEEFRKENVGGLLPVERQASAGAPVAAP